MTKLKIQSCIDHIDFQRDIILRLINVKTFSLNTITYYILVKQKKSLITL